MSIRLVISPSFAKKLQKLIKKNPDLEKRINKTLKLIRKNPQHPSLRFHKLRNSAVISVSVNMSLRILFLHEGNTLFLLDIGTHDQVYDG